MKILVVCSVVVWLSLIHGSWLIQNLADIPSNVFNPRNYFRSSREKIRFVVGQTIKDCLQSGLLQAKKKSLRDLPHILHVFFFIVSVASNRMLSPLLYWFLILWQNEAGSAGGQKKGPTKVLGC